ncbi:hypothetical protein SUGI_0816650 [Cryptomeria japonica]|nr:hypothetical protein SUGI_0816650 [Cryptomeria japonica]
MKRGRSSSPSTVVVVTDASEFSKVVQELTGMPKPNVAEKRQENNEKATEKSRLIKPVAKRPTVDQVAGNRSPWLSVIVPPSFASSSSNTASEWELYVNYGDASEE